MRTLLLLTLGIWNAKAYRASDFIHAAHMTEESFYNMQEKLGRLNDLQHQILGEEVPKRHPGKINLDQEVEAKPEQSPFLFEGDIVLSDEQMDKIIENAEDVLWAQSGNNHRRKARSMTSNLRERWSASQPIRWFIADRRVDANAVVAGINFWLENTCFTFQQQYYPISGNGLHFIYGNGCFSAIGMAGFTYQQVSIGGGCTSLGTVTHEIGHALGFFHEQGRYDRDNYVDILWNNIIYDKRDQFTKLFKSYMEDYGASYDFGSVMHYETNAFSVNFHNAPAIITKDRNYQNTIGQRSGASFSDIKQANMAYCTHVCSNKLDCQHRGYVDPKNCAKCRCPDGFGGNLCERAANSPSACGVGDLTATNDFQTIQANGRQKCSYVITAPAGRNVYFEVIHSSFYQTTISPCVGEYLEIKYNEDFASAGARFCSNSRPSVRLTKSNKLVVIYSGGVDYYRRSTRFTLRFRQDPLGPVETTQLPTTTRRPTVQPPTVPPSTFAPTTISTTQRTTTSIIDPTCSDWTPCTAQCGGCGTKTRRCGRTLQTFRCNTTPCDTQFCCKPFFYSLDGRCVRPYGDKEIIEKKEKNFYTEEELAEARKRRGGNGWYKKKN